MVDLARMKCAALGSVSALACNFWRPRQKWAGEDMGLSFRVSQRRSCFLNVPGEGAEGNTRWRVCSPSRISDLRPEITNSARF